MGLWLNVPRVRMQWAAMGLAGTAAAGHNNPLDPAWADAIARFPEEADEIEFQMNSARAMAKAFSKRGPG